MEPILEVRHLSKSFGKNEVLRDIDFTVSKGDVTSIIGASGSGKSTLCLLYTSVESYRMKRLLHCPEPSHSVGSGLFVLPEPEIPALPQHSPAKFKKER